MDISPPIAAQISERLQRDSVQDLECTIPEDMTLDEWRRLRPRTTGRRPRRRLSRTPRNARHLKLVPDVPRDDPAPLAA